MSDTKKIDYIQQKVDSVASTVARIDNDMATQKATFEAHTAQDERMYEELKRMNDILQENTLSLREHMQNNHLLREMIEKMDNRLNPIEVDFIEKNAVKNWVLTKSKFIVKIAGAFAAVAAAWVYIKPLVEHLISLR